MHVEPLFRRPYTVIADGPSVISGDMDTIPRWRSGKHARHHLRRDREHLPPNTAEADPRMISAVLDALRLPTGTRVVDVGAGTGNYANALAALYWTP